jgi:hypothetical protein
MAHYAILNENNIVTQVIVGKDENETYNGQVVNWEEYYGGKRTSFNTIGGVHNNGGIPFRKNYAGIGYIYDAQRDAFIPPKPFNSWILDETSCLWEAPVAYPTDGERYTWNEETTSWDVAEVPA